MSSTTSQPAALRFGIGYDVGRKRAGRANQDSVGTYADILPDQDSLAKKGRLFILADGMGGAAGGQVASQMAVHVTLPTYYQDYDSNVLRSLAGAIQNANMQIYTRAQNEPTYEGMGTTIVAAVLRDDMLHVANVGDSRAYLLRDGELLQLSRDHTLVQEQVRGGLLTQEQAAAHRLRHVLSRNLGSKAKAEPDFASEKVRQGDILLLCSDGLWGELSESEITALLHKYEPSEAAQALVRLANEHGGSDNISLIVLGIDQLLLPTGSSHRKDAFCAYHNRQASRDAQPILAHSARRALLATTTQATTMQMDRRTLGLLILALYLSLALIIMALFAQSVLPNVSSQEAVSWLVC